MFYNRKRAGILKQKMYKWEFDSWSSPWAMPLCDKSHGSVQSKRVQNKMLNDCFSLRTAFASPTSYFVQHLCVLPLVFKSKAVILGNLSHLIILTLNTRSYKMSSEKDPILDLNGRKRRGKGKKQVRKRTRKRKYEEGGLYLSRQDNIHFSK